MPKTAMVHDVGMDSRPRRREGWKYGRLELPVAVQTQLSQIDLADVFSAPETLISSGTSMNKLLWRRSMEVNRLLGKVTAEIHGRLAYGLSCLLLVPLGAMLGLIFRDGQTISAFAISIAPASGMILMIYMGRRIIENPEAPEILGLAALWGSSLALAVIDVVIYWRMSRR
jgi:lipopolysaccharide export LptBFGC system permease protein LptF